MEMLANRRLQRQRSIIANTCRKLMENEERRRSDKLIMQDAYDKFVRKMMKALIVKHDYLIKMGHWNQL